MLQLCTTAFLVEISQYIKIGDLTMFDYTPPPPDMESAVPSQGRPNLPSLAFDDVNDSINDLAPRLSDEEEDELLRDTSASFADWVASFIRRVIQLLENLPEEGANGAAGGATEGIVCKPSPEQS